MNWISPTGLNPCAAIPTHSPLIKSSASGVSITRSGPNRCCSPTVARNTPPFTPTSSPSTTTFASSAMARASAKLTASTSVTSAMGGSLDLIALAHIDLRKLGIEMIEHGFGPARTCCQVVLDGRIDARLAIGGKLFFFGFGPQLLGHEIGPQARDRLLLPVRLDLFRRSIARGIICGRVIAQPIGHSLDQHRPIAASGLRDRVLGCGPHGNNIVAVHLLTGN